MKMPLSPPNWREIAAKMDSRQVEAALEAARETDQGSSYLHWDKLIHLSPPEPLTVNEWWAGLKLGRLRSYAPVPLVDTTGKPFRHTVTDFVIEQLHRIDLTMAGKPGAVGEIVSPDTRDQLMVSSLVEEAITSSQLEGAVTTRDVAREMIRLGRSPKDKSERMILNNFHTMRQINAIRNETLSPDLLFELHRLTTENTLEEAGMAGRFRRDSDRIVVADAEGTVLHVPPSAETLVARMSQLCDFANGTTPTQFVHPVLRAIILHFWMAYDHPFIDGNGRTARALFYWSMLHSGYWLYEFLSISTIILKAPLKYARAYLYTETDDNDLTYFIVYHLDIMRRAFEALEADIRQRAVSLENVEGNLRALSLFNHRQRALLSHALRHPRTLYSTEGHRSSHDVAYQTARNDITDLAQRGLLVASKQGRTWLYSAAPDLATRLVAL